MKKIIFFASLLLCFLLLSSSYAQIPHLINYQGKLTDKDGDPVTDGNYSVTFRIYDAESGGALLWEETQSILVQKGIFFCLLGGVTNLNLAFDKPYWLAIKVGSDSEMTPRQQIASAGYAIRAEMAENVVSIPRGIITIWSGSINDAPEGWAICDGNNGTPNLTDRFVIHADSDSGGINDVGNTGGAHSVALSIAELPPHTHTVDHGDDGSGSNVVNADGGDYQRKDGSVTTSSTGGGQPHENRPKYYALAYIMKL